MNLVRDMMPFQESKLRPNLKMAAQRITLVNNKKENGIKHQKREIATLLSAGKEEKARIRAEHLIRDDFTIEAYEIIGLLCDLVHERMKHLLSQEECPSDLIGTVATLLYAAPRVEISEMEVVSKQLIKKFGKKFAEEVVIPENNYVNPRVIEKLAVRPPSADAVLQYLGKIAEEFNVDWTPTEIGLTSRTEAVPTPTGYSVPMAPGSQYGDIYYQGGGQVQQAVVAAPPTFAMSMEHPSAYSSPSLAPPLQGPPPEYSAGGVKKRSAMMDSAMDSEYEAGVMALPPPPAYSPHSGGSDGNSNSSSNNNRNDNGGGQAGPPIVQAEVYIPPAPSSASAPASAQVSASPGYDDLAARFAALSK